MFSRPDSPLYKALVFLLALCPFLWVVFLAAQNKLGTDPGKALVLFLGIWSIRFVVLVLCVTPLKQLTGWSWLIRYRRMVGLYTLFYVSMHLLSYVLFLANLEDLLADIIKRPYITVGFAAFLLLIPLGLTSTKGMMRRLGKRWKQLQQLIYVIAILGCVHFVWLSRSDAGESLLYCLLVGGLLLLRLLNRLGIKTPRLLPPSTPR